MPLCKYGPAPDGRTHPSLQNWGDKYKFFSHVLADRRVKTDCGFFDGMKSQERFKTFDGAEANKELNLAARKQLPNPEHHSFEATMSRILDIVEAMNPHEKPVIHPKHKWFGGGCNMSERFERSALLEQDDLLVYKATRDASRPRRPQTAPAGRHSSAKAATPTPSQPVAMGKENQCTTSQNQDTQKEEELDILKAAMLEAPSRFPPRPKSASVTGSSKPQSESKATDCRPSKMRPKSACATGSSRSALEQVQMTEAQKLLQRPKSAIAIGGSRSPSQNDEIPSAQVSRKPRSASTSMLSRSQSGSNVSSCISTAGSTDPKRHHPAAVTAPEWAGGNIQRPGHGQKGPPAFPKRFHPRKHSKPKAKVGQDFFPLCKDLSMYIRS